MRLNSPSAIIFTKSIDPKYIIRANPIHRYSHWKFSPVAHNVTPRSLLGHVINQEGRDASGQPSPLMSASPTAMSPLNMTATPAASMLEGSVCITPDKCFVPGSSFAHNETNSSLTPMADVEEDLQTLPRSPVPSSKGVCSDQETNRTSSRGAIPRARVKTIKMTLVIVIVFILCWTPFFLWDLLQVGGFILTLHLSTWLIPSFTHCPIRCIIISRRTSRRSSSPPSSRVWLRSTQLRTRSSTSSFPLASYIP